MNLSFKNPNIPSFNKWLYLLVFYCIILGATYISRQLPNFLQFVLELFTDVYFPWNFNHGIAVLIITSLFYHFHLKKRTFSFFGTSKLLSIVFPIILMTTYGIIGFKNDQGINEHLWAIVFCLFSLIYNLMEEYAWRAYFNDHLTGINIWIKSIISGIFWAVWHLLIFKDFDQYGGFHIFLLFCIIFSILLNLSILKTRSILVAASVHAVLIKTNIATAAIGILFLLLIIFWNKLNNRINSQ